MKITVTSVGQGWKPANAAPDFKPIYTLVIAGQGEPQKTQDPLLAVPGEHEAETYQTKSGKTYWRAIEASQDSVGQDDTRNSIERQQALIQAVAFVNGNMASDDSERLKLVESAYSAFLNLLAGVSGSVSSHGVTPQAEYQSADLPPIENYDV